MSGSALFVDKRLPGAVSHVESAWSVVARPYLGVHLLTNLDRVVGVAAILVRGVDSATHAWVDVPLKDWHACRTIAAETRSPAKIVARFDDAVAWVDAAQAGPIAYLCGEDGQPRVRIMANRMAPVRVGSLW